MADEVKLESAEDVGFFGGIIQEIINSPLNLALIAIITFLIFKIFKSRQPPKPSPPAEPELPKLRKDFTVAELKAFDGNQPEGRVLVAVNGNVYDVTRGKRFYGPGESIYCIGAAPFQYSKFRLSECLPTLFSSSSFCFASNTHFTSLPVCRNKLIICATCCLCVKERDVYMCKTQLIN